MGKNEGLMKVVVVAIIFALMLVAMPVGADSGLPGDYAKMFEIPPTGKWASDSLFNTHINVTMGQTVSIIASGRVQPSTSQDLFCGPDGTFAVDYWLTDYSFRSDWGHEALIARIGAAGTPIFIGTSSTFTAPTGGEVWLGVNDIDPSNNVGEFVVEVCLGQASTPTPTPTPQQTGCEPQKGTECDILRSKLEEQKNDLEIYKNILEDQKAGLKTIETEISNIMINAAGISWGPNSDPDWDVAAKNLGPGDSLKELYDPTYKWTQLDKAKIRLTQNMNETEDNVKALEIQISNTEMDLGLCLEGPGGEQK